MVKRAILTVTTFMCMLFLPGGHTKIKDVKKNQEVQELGRFCVEESNQKVVKAESQVVSDN